MSVRVLSPLNKHAFPRAVRLTHPLHYRRVFRHAVRIGNRSVTILASPNEFGFARLGLAISRKCAARAVQRNRIKRLVRESFRLHQHQLPAVDIIVMCRPTMNTMTNRNIIIMLEKLWQRLYRECEN